MMHAHFSVHWDHGHAGLLGRVARDLGAAYAWLAGPALSEQERQRRELAEIGAWNHLSGAL